MPLKGGSAKLLSRPSASGEENIMPDVNGLPPLRQCAHVSAVNLEKCKKKVTIAKNWRCAECGEAEDIWTCLACSHVGCGRSTQGHALAHHKDSEHPLCVHMYSGSCHCYACDDFVEHDNRAGDITLFRTVLEAVRYSLMRRDDEQLLAMKSVFKRPLNQEIRQDSKRRKGEGASKQSVSLAPGFTGLRSLGNTCFMNAVLQTLSYTHNFRQYFMANDFNHLNNVCISPLPFSAPTAIPTSNTTGPITRRSAARHVHNVSICKEVKNVFDALWSGTMQAYSPDSFFSTVWRVLPHFYGFHQHDAQEFLRYLLDRIHLELTHVKQNTLDVLSTSSKRQKAVKHASKSIVMDTFQGMLLSEVRCLKCGEISKKLDPFLDLSVTIPERFLLNKRIPQKSEPGTPVCTLLNCLRHFTDPECLEATEKFECRTCVSQQLAVKRFVLEKLPDVLSIHIKRFRWPNRSKINTLVQFPTHLDTADLTSEKRNSSYELFAVINHHGSGTWSGHYTAYCLSPSNVWVSFNDSEARICSIEDVMNSQAYILFYRRSYKEDDLTS